MRCLVLLASLFWQMHFALTEDSLYLDYNGREPGELLPSSELSEPMAAKLDSGQRAERQQKLQVHPRPHILSEALQQKQMKPGSVLAIQGAQSDSPKKVSFKIPKPTEGEDDYDDNDDASDEDDGNPDDDDDGRNDDEEDDDDDNDVDESDEKSFLQRISCLLQALHSHTMAMAEDLTELGSSFNLDNGNGDETDNGDDNNDENNGDECDDDGDDDDYESSDDVQDMGSDPFGQTNDSNDNYGTEEPPIATTTCEPECKPVVPCGFGVVIGKSTSTNGRQQQLDDKVPERLGTSCAQSDYYSDVDNHAERLTLHNSLNRGVEGVHHTAESEKEQRADHVEKPEADTNLDFDDYDEDSDGRALINPSKERMLDEEHIDLDERQQSQSPQSGAKKALDSQQLWKQHFERCKNLLDATIDETSHLKPSPMAVSNIMPPLLKLLTRSQNSKRRGADLGPVVTIRRSNYKRQSTPMVRQENVNYLRALNDMRLANSMQAGHVKEISELVPLSLSVSSPMANTAKQYAINLKRLIANRDMLEDQAEQVLAD